MESLVRFRESTGLSQSEFAELIGLKQSHYQAIESGRVRLNSDHIERLTKAFPQINLNDLFGRPKDVEVPIQHPDESVLTKLAYPLVLLIEQFYDPHTTVVIRTDGVEVVSSVLFTPIKSEVIYDPRPTLKRSQDVR